MTNPEPFSKLIWNRTIDKRGLTPTAVLVLDEMFDRASMDGTEIFGTQESIAAKVGKSISSVRRAQRQIESRGLVVLVERGIELRQQVEPVRAEISGRSSPVILRKLTGHFGS